MSHVFKSIGKVACVCIQRSNNVAWISGVKNYCTSVNKNRSKRFYEYLDSNKDGRVDKQDFRNQALKLFVFTYEYDYDTFEKAYKRLDNTNKGSISIEDVEAYLKSAKLPSEEVFKLEFQSMDKDKDGLISFEDILAGYGEMDNLNNLIIKVGLKREFKLMGKGEHDKITLEEYVERNLYKHFLGLVLQIAEFAEFK